MTLLWLLLLAAPDETAEARRLTELVAHSGRVVESIAASNEKIAPAPQIAPGAPPLLSFRYFDGKLRHRFGDVDLVLDDAGH